MHFPNPLIRGSLISRYKRFLADIRLENGQLVTAHCPNPGRMTQCNAPGSPVLLSISDNPKRKLRYTLELVHSGTSWVGVHSLLANTIAEEGLRSGHIRELTGFELLKREVGYGRNSRADFLLQNDGQRVYIEVKSVTLVEDGVAKFPDAVTARGRKHLYELAEVVAAGHRGVTLYIVQREDARSFTPAIDIDPAYAHAVQETAAQGVEILVYDCRVNETGIFLHNAIEWRLNA